MKERPILMSAPMVRAILDGRKTQTRRIVKPQPLKGVKVDSTWIRPFERRQRLWVCENWARCSLDHDPSCVIYRADYEPEDQPPAEFGAWKSSATMPRWASRITLEITNVRVERLQDISEADAAAEGATGDCPVGNISVYQAAPLGYHFAQIWDDTYPDSWANNPWVWVVEFRRVEQ